MENHQDSVEKTINLHKTIDPAAKEAVEQNSLPDNSPAPISAEQKMLAVLGHLSYLLGGLGFIIAPLLIMILKKDDRYVYCHAKQALAVHLAVFAVSLTVGLLCFLLIGLLLLPFLAILWVMLLVTSIIATVKALEGSFYHYPFVQWLVAKF